MRDGKTKTLLLCVDLDLDLLSPQRVDAAHIT